MTIPRTLSTLALAGLLAGCIEKRADEVATITLDYLTTAQAAALAEPYLSSQGKVFASSEALNTITVRDRRDNVRRVERLLGERDASPQNISLHFQVVRATEAGSIDPALEKVGTALRELLRFKGYDLVAQTVVSATERRTVEQSVDVGDLSLQIGLRINDVVDDGVDMEVQLRRPGHASLLTTNLVLPMRQTVVLGSAYPGGGGDALILTVRGEMGSTKLRRTSSNSDARSRLLAEEAAHEAQHAATAARVEAAAAVAAAIDAMNAEQADLATEIEALASQPRMKGTAPAKRVDVHITPAAPPARAATRVRPPPGE